MGFESIESVRASLRARVRVRQQTQFYFFCLFFVLEEESSGHLPISTPWDCFLAVL